MPLFPFFRDEGLFSRRRRWWLLCNEMLPLTSCCAGSRAPSRKMTAAVSVPEVGDVQTWKPLPYPNDCPACRSSAWQQNETRAAKNQKGRELDVGDMMLPLLMP